MSPSLAIATPGAWSDIGLTGADLEQSGRESPAGTPPSDRLQNDALDRCSVRAMDKDHITGRLHDAMHRGNHKATEQELAEVTVVVLAIVGELASELAAVIADLSQRVEALEARA